MITFDEAVRLLSAATTPLAREEVPVKKAHRRILAEPVAAGISSPRADVSSMDGYAVRDADLQPLPSRLQVVGESFPGRGSEVEVRQGECLRVFTGAPVPTGADRILIQEAVRRDGNVLLVETPPEAPRYIRKAGSDFAQADLLLGPGTLLTPRHLVAAAAADAARLTVWRRPRLALLATGDELVAPGSARTASGPAIPDSITPGLAAFAEQWGGEVVSTRRLADDLADLEQAAASALDEADLIVVTGGASVGERDFAKPMFARHGLELIFSKVRMKPGKPVWFGRAGGKLVLGLPGNPTSAMVTARLFLAPLLAGLSGRDPASAHAWRQAALAHAVGPTGDRETFARAVMEYGRVRLARDRDSGAQQTLAASDLLVRLATDAPGYEPGAMVDLLDF